MNGTGDLIVRASVWLALLCYPAGPAAAWLPSRVARGIWTLGCAAFLVHVAASFHVHYDWSHAVALDETARQSAAATGRAVGAGLWLNYLFTAAWVADATWWWTNPASRAGRSRWIDLGLHGFFLFMIVNGAVIFASGPVRWLGVLVCAAGIAALVAGRMWRRERG